MLQLNVHSNGRRALCAVVLLAFAACKPSGSNRSAAPDAAQPLRALNVVLVTIDTLRADHVHCYGNGHIETPTLDSLAERGVRFEKAVAQTPLTPPSHASIFTGTNPNVHHVRNTGGFALQSSSVTLATILKTQGWDTGAFVGSTVLKKASGFAHGFDVYDDQMPKPEKSLEERGAPSNTSAQATCSRSMCAPGSKPRSPGTRSSSSALVRIIWHRAMALSWVTLRWR